MRAPASYRELHPFWTSLGYEKQPKLQARLHWQEIGQSTESEHRLSFWTKSLRHF